jgi:hypothetical protein
LIGHTAIKGLAAMGGKCKTPAMTRGATGRLIQILINWFGLVRVISSIFARIIVAFAPPL